MMPIHNFKERMPLILRPDMKRMRLRPGLMKEEINNLIVPLEDDMLAALTI